MTPQERVTGFGHKGKVSSANAPLAANDYSSGTCQRLALETAPHVHANSPCHLSAPRMCFLCFAPSALIGASTPLASESPTGGSARALETRGASGLLALMGAALN